MPAAMGLRRPAAPSSVGSMRPCACARFYGRRRGYRSRGSAAGRRGRRRARSETNRLAVAELIRHPNSGSGSQSGSPTPLRAGQRALFRAGLPMAAIGHNYLDHVREMGRHRARHLPRACGGRQGTGPIVYRPGHPRAVLKAVHRGNGRCAARCPQERVSERDLRLHLRGRRHRARPVQAKDGQWARAKGFDTFCPLGPWIETDTRPRRPGADHDRERRDPASPRNALS